MVKVVLKRRVDGPAEIAYLENIEIIQYIFRFYVTVDDIVTVQVSDSAYHLSEVEGGEVFFEVILFADFFEEAS